MRNVRGKVVVITGASSGFGEAIARQCVAAGAKVVLAARGETRLAGLVQQLGAANALAVPCDITRQEDVDRLLQRTLERYGVADVLVNNAGFGKFAHLADASLADLQAMMDVNVYGAVRCTQAFLPGMLARRKGQIVVVASLAGLIATQNMGYYNATKFALVGYARTLMLELKGSGVRCTLVCPGPALTGFQAQGAPVESYPRSSRLVPWISADLVGSTVIRAIRRRTQGEVLLPWQARPLVLAASLFPRLSRGIMQLIGE